jgi:hypothetical protein
MAKSTLKRTRVDVILLALSVIATWIVTGYAVLQRNMSVSQEEFILFFLIVTGVTFIIRTFVDLSCIVIKGIRKGES